MGCVRCQEEHSIRTTHSQKETQKHVTQFDQLYPSPVDVYELRTDS